MAAVAAARRWWWCRLLTFLVALVLPYEIRVCASVLLTEICLSIYICATLLLVQAKKAGARAPAMVNCCDKMMYGDRVYSDAQEKIEQAKEAREEKRAAAAAAAGAGAGAGASADDADDDGAGETTTLL